MSLLDSNERNLRVKYEYVPKQRRQWTERMKKELRCTRSTYKRLVPIFSWLPKYPLRKFIVGDVIAGLTTAIVRIPQGLAYGLLAGLMPINGLYTGFFSPLVYSIFGTSRHISVGVFSIVSLMLGAALEKYNENPSAAVTSGQLSSSNSLDKATENNTSTFNVTDVAALGNSSLQNSQVLTPLTEQETQNLMVICSLTVLIGINLFILGIFRLGIVAMFLSEPVVSGFTNAAAMYVVTAQMKYVTGIPLKGRTGFLGLINTWIELFTRLNEIYWPSIVVSVICLAVLIPVKYVNRNYRAKLRNIPIPVELLVVIIGTLVSGLTGYGQQNISLIVGEVPKGMPSPILPDVSMWPDLIGDSISIAIIIFAVAVSLGKIFAKKHGYSIDPNQELLALGLCQLTCGFFQGHSGGGALARSSVQESSGGNSQVASLVSCGVLLLVLLVIGPLFEHLPKACLACIILANLHGLLIQFQTLPAIWRIDRYDFSAWLVTFGAVIVFGIDTGLGIGVVFSLICGVLRTSNARLSAVGELVGSDEFGEVENFKAAVETPGIKIIRFNQSPTYANKSILLQLTPAAAFPVPEYSGEDSESDKLKFEGRDALPMDEVGPERQTDRRIVIIDCSRWSIIDIVGLSTLKLVIQDLVAEKIDVYLASLADSIYRKLESYGVIGIDSILHPNHTFHSLTSAVQTAKKAIGGTDDCANAIV